MNAHHFHYLLRQVVEHKNPENVRLHLGCNVVGWLALSTALSQLPQPLQVPLLGANVGALFVVACGVYWLLADVVSALCVVGLALLWAQVPGWGPGHGWLLPVLALAVFAGMNGLTRLGHIYHHEHGAYLKGEPQFLHTLHVWLFGPFHFALQTLLAFGFRPRLSAQLREGERELLSGREQVPWRNWAEIEGCDVQFVCMPQTVEELVAAVRVAIARGKGVRVVGSGFSWSALVPTGDSLIFCERLCRIEVDVSNPEAPTVWAEAGATNRQLNHELARHGLCMPWNVVLENVRVAGIAATGTHGTGRKTATVGDLVEAFEIIDAQGEMRVLSEETVGPEMMSAARLGLGLFGVIARVKLRVIKSYRVRQTDLRLSVSDVLQKLPELVGAHDSVELYWFPFNRDMWMRTIDRTEDASTWHGHGFWFKAQNLMQNAWLVLFSKLVMRFAPSLTPLLLKLGMRMLPFRSRVLELPESHHYHHWIEMMPAGCMEVGFKVDDDFANVREAWTATERLVETYASRGLYPLNLTLNVRFIGPSGALLTPAYGEGLTCYVEIMWMCRPEGWKEFSSELCREWLKVPGALPHWSKEFEHVEDVVALSRTALGDRLERYLALLEQSGIDPEGRFFNGLTRRVLTDKPPAV